MVETSTSVGLVARELCGLIVARGAYKTMVNDNGIALPSNATLAGSGEASAEWPESTASRRTGSSKASTVGYAMSY